MIWIRTHIQPVLLFLGAVALALKPAVVGTSHYGLTGWISVAILVVGAGQTYIAPNVEGGVGVEIKDGILILSVGLSTLLNVAPNGFSRADIWTVGEAVVVVAIPLIFPNPTTKFIRPQRGAGQMGDQHRHLA